MKKRGNLPNERQKSAMKAELSKRVKNIKVASKGLIDKVDKKGKIAILGVLSLVAFIVLPSFVKLYALPLWGYNEFRKGKKL